MSALRGAILLADDEEKILKRLGRALREEGHDVVEAATMREAQRQLEQRAFDLLVVDNIMPGMTGLELIRQIAQTMPPTATAMSTDAAADTAQRVVSIRGIGNGRRAPIPPRTVSFRRGGALTSGTASDRWSMAMR